MTPPKIVPKAFVSFGSIVMRIAGKCSCMSLQKWIGLSFQPNRSRRPVPGDHEGIVIECHELLVNRREYIRSRPSPEICSANAIPEKCISRKDNVPATGQEK